MEKALVAVAGAARLGGGGEALRAAQGCYYAGVITQPKHSPETGPRAGLGAAPQTSPGAASCPQPSTRDTRLRRTCPIAAWLGTSVPPGSCRTRGAVLEDKALVLSSAKPFCCPPRSRSGLPKLADLCPPHLTGPAQRPWEQREPLLHLWAFGL